MLLGLISVIAIQPVFATEPVGTDADDPAIWVNRHNRSQSLIFGTDKAVDKGGLFAFNLEGKVVQRIENLKYPNNCDVWGNLLVVSERDRNRVIFYSINAKTGALTDVTGDSGVVTKPMGVAFYRRERDGAVFVFVSPKAGDRDGYLAQYRLVQGSDGRYGTKLVRKLGKFSGVDEIESIAVDHDRGLVYYSDEGVANRVYQADPALAGDPFVTGFNTRGMGGDHEGIAVTKDFVFTTDQREGNAQYRVFDRWQTGRMVGTLSIGADSTDGIDATQENLGPRFPEGIFVAMNSKDRNFLIADFREVRRAFPLR
ncbi:MAG: phytase [Chthonomonas sp.]|nr:phytase [Chthonomonas sp.]